MKKYLAFYSGKAKDLQTTAWIPEALANAAHLNAYIPTRRQG